MWPFIGFHDPLYVHTPAYIWEDIGGPNGLSKKRKDMKLAK